MVASSAETMVTDLELAELEQRLPAWTRELLDCVTSRQREAFVLREVLDLPFDQVGERMDVTVECVRQHHLAAVKTITDAARRAALLTKHVPLVVLHLQAAKSCAVPREMRSALELPVAVLNLGLRTATCLDSCGIKNLGDLVQKSEGDVLKIWNLGRKSLKEIKKALAALGLHLAMSVDDPIL